MQTAQAADAIQAQAASSATQGPDNSARGHGQFQTPTVGYNNHVSQIPSTQQPDAQEDSEEESEDNPLFVPGATTQSVVPQPGANVSPNQIIYQPFAATLNEMIREGRAYFGENGSKVDELSEDTPSRESARLQVPDRSEKRVSYDRNSGAGRSKRWGYHLRDIPFIPTVFDTGRWRLDEIPPWLLHDLRHHGVSSEDILERAPLDLMPHVDEKTFKRKWGRHLRDKYASWARNRGALVQLHEPLSQMARDILNGHHWQGTRPPLTAEQFLFDVTWDLDLKDGTMFPRWNSQHRYRLPTPLARPRDALMVSRRIEQIPVLRRRDLNLEWLMTQYPNLPPPRPISPNRANTRLESPASSQAVGETRSPLDPRAREFTPRAEPEQAGRLTPRAELEQITRIASNPWQQGYHNILPTTPLPLPEPALPRNEVPYWQLPDAFNLPPPNVSQMNTNIMPGQIPNIHGYQNLSTMHQPAPRHYGNMFNNQYPTQLQANQFNTYPPPYLQERQLPPLPNVGSSHMPMQNNPQQHMAQTQQIPALPFTNGALGMQNQRSFSALPMGEPRQLRVPERYQHQVPPRHASMQHPPPQQQQQFADPFAYQVEPHLAAMQGHMQQFVPGVGWQSVQQPQTASLRPSRRERRRRENHEQGYFGQRGEQGQKEGR